MRARPRLLNRLRRGALPHRRWRCDCLPSVAQGGQRGTSQYRGPDRTTPHAPGIPGRVPHESGGSKPDMSSREGPTAEHRRLVEQAKRLADWQRWGTYVAERAWGTVREDYSPDGNAWEYFPHDHARSRAYRWNEDGLAGFCDPVHDL